MNYHKKQPVIKCLMFFFIKTLPNAQSKLRKNVIYYDVCNVKRNSRILKEVHEMASDLHEIGLIDKRRMREFAALCNLDAEEIPSQKIKQLREEAHISQAVFAAVLNTSLSTIQKWEIGDKKPSGPSLKLLSLIERKGLEAVL